MNKTSHLQRVSFVAVIGILSFAVGMWPATSGSSHPPDPKQFSANSSAPGSLAGVGDYFLVRQDRRRCISPLCGGYFVKRVNQRWTRCANGRWMRECYVAEIDWNGQPEVDPGKALLHGDIVARRFPRFGNLGALRVTESWQSPSEKPATDTLYRVRDRGVRCITHPCLTHSATRLGFAFTKNIAGVDLAAAGASGELISEGAAAMTHPDGVIVAGYFAPVTGPGGRAQTLKATKFYLRAGAQIDDSQPPGGAKRCFKTGCSSQVCADHNVITTCEYRPEYECYRKAACERQRNGECGFTQTAELTACLARARRN
ncbi:MAG TPA: DUF6748 domain-containing protein [Pyrinomonadaceae bacterium]